MQIEILTLELRGSQLEAIPQDERVLLVQMGHLANTIMVLQKWLVFCEVRAAPKSVEAAAATTQQMLVMRILSGVLYEGWRVIQTSYFKAQLSKKYDAKLSDDGKEYLATLKDYFNHGNSITRVRNKVAFHFDRCTVVNELNLVERNKPYHLYLSECQGNSLYYLSEELVGFAMLHGVQDLTDATEIPGVLNQLFDDLVRISRAFAGFIGACLLLVLRDNLPSLEWNDLERINVPDVPALDQVRIPFFVSKPSDDTRASE